MYYTYRNDLLDFLGIPRKLPVKYNFLATDNLLIQTKLVIVDEIINVTENPLITFINEFSKGYDDGIRVKYIYMIIKARHPQYLLYTPSNSDYYPALGYFKDLKYVDLMTLAGKVVIDSIPSGKIPTVTDYGGLSIPDIHYSDIKDFFKNYDFIPDLWWCKSTRPFYPFK